MPEAFCVPLYQVSAIKQRFAKQRGEVQAELASKRSEVNGRRAARDEERKVLDEALAELDAALADVESAIQVSASAERAEAPDGRRSPALWLLSCMPRY